MTYDRKSEVVAIWDIGDKISKLASRRAKLTPWTHLSDVKFTPDGKRFAFVSFPRSQDRSATEICFWDSRTLDEIARISPARGVDAFAFTANGKRLLMAQPNGALGERNSAMWK